MDDLEPELESSDNSENEDLRQMILEQLASMEPSDISDEESYQVRLSCILEDDESESSASQGRSKDFSKNGAAPQKMGERDKTSSDVTEDNESCDNVTTLCDDYDLANREEVQVTDLDDFSIKISDVEDSPSEKTEIQIKTEERRAEIEDTEEEEEDEDAVVPEVPFGIKRLKSSDNVLERKFVPKRTEFSSDSSDIDISISNEKPSDVTDVPVMVSGMDAGRTSLSENDNSSATEESMFVKVSKSCVERCQEEGNHEEDSESRVGSVERELLAGQSEPDDPKSILQVIQLRSKSPRVYTPPVPPETYLWEELKRIRGKGGYPWTYLDKPPFDEAAWKKYMEHEYEPINPPPLSPFKRKEKEEENIGSSRNDSGIPDTKDTQTRINESSEKELKTEEDMEVEEIATSQELLDRVESRNLAQTPTTTASRTDADVNTSMLDSSGLEDVPLKRGARNKVRRQAYGIQQKIRCQAGKIRNKLRNIPKPVTGSKEKSTNGTTQEKSRFRLPEAPKFKLPERPKFNLPERPKFNLPERPKFHLPERPKLHLPERPKLHLPERPKLHLPERPKFHLPERPKLHLPDRSKFHLPERPKLHLPERPKFHFPEKSKFTLPEMSKFHLPERPKLHFPERPKINLQNLTRPLRSRQETGPRKNIFELDLKSYPKIFSKSKQKCEYTTSSPKKTRGSTPPPKMCSEQPSAPQRKKVPVGQRWLKKMDDIKYADADDMSAEMKTSRRSDRSESLSDFRDKDLGGYMEDLDDSRYPPGGRKTLSTKSSMSHMSDRDIESIASSEGRRKGVLEEINSDEFFLRQKGISQEDIDMGKYLSHEIREAFRSPEVNALAKMDYDFEDMGNEPSKPARTRSLKKKSSLKKYFESDPALSESSGYKTYPPRRPNRKSRSRSKSLVNEEAVVEAGPTYENEPGLQDDNVSEYYKVPGPAKEYEPYKVPRPITDTTPVPIKRTKSGRKKVQEEMSLETSVEAINHCRPQPLTRRRSKKSLDGRQDFPNDGEVRREDEEKLKEHEYIIPEDPYKVLDEAPVPPRRTRSLTRSLRSEGLNESREAMSSIEPKFERVDIPVDTQSLTHMEIAKPHHYEMADDDPGFGYATIGKPIVSRPARQKKEKPQRPPPPKRKRDLTSFNTVPRKAIPIRPMRNYSTLGPSRPPRKAKASAERPNRSYAEIEPESTIMPLRYEECHGSNKDLQKEEVIEKMKGRPLPPPPRPPRQKSKGPEDFEEVEESKIAIALLKGEASPVEVEAVVHAPPSEPVEEVCVSTQTDPVPDDFLIDVEDEIIQELSHEQLKIQQEFLEQIRSNEAEASTADQEGVPIEEERRISERLERELLEELRREAEMTDDGKKREELLEQPFDVDLGYASLDRRQHKQENEPSAALPASLPTAIHVPVIPDIETSVKVLRTDKLDVKELEVDRLNVRELQAQSITMSNLQTNQLTADEVSTRSGNLSLNNIDLPSGAIQQIFENLPWGELCSPAARALQEGMLRLAQSERSDETPVHSPPPRRHRRQRRMSSSSGEESRPRRSVRHQNPQSVTELSKQLGKACAASGVRAMHSIASRIQNTQIEDKALLMRAILFILALLVAGLLLLGGDRQTILHHHWDFQFPPQPPPHQF